MRRRRVFGVWLIYTGSVVASYYPSDQDMFDAKDEGLAMLVLKGRAFGRDWQG